MNEKVVYVEFPRTRALTKIPYLILKDGTKVINLNYGKEVVLE